MGQKFFKIEQFVATEHTPAVLKSEFADRVANFIIKGFRPGDFTNIIYNRLCQCFGHIAHNDRGGFYDTWFAGPERQAKFIRNLLNYKPIGSPKYTFSDVEVALQEWLIAQKIQTKVEAEARNERLYIALENTIEQVLSIFVDDRTQGALSVIVDQTAEFLCDFIGDGKFDVGRVEEIKTKLIQSYWGG